MQTPLWQSPAPLQRWSAAHLVHDPPQSTSLSVPFLSASSHAAAWHTCPEQSVLAQSVPSEHALPSAQSGQSGPPQSTSVSKPSLIELVQLGALHAPPTHVPGVQSPLRKQFLP